MVSLDAISSSYFLDKNYSTKCHNYIPGYTKLFDPVRQTVKTMLEIGIGSVENGQMCGVVPLGYKTGNSLRCWRDYFPNAIIYGIDIYEHSLNEDRIKTYVADQSNGIELDAVVHQIKAPLDIIIDDGSHECKHQVYSFMVLEKYLSPNGIYVIEDIQPSSINGFLDLSHFPGQFRDYIKKNYTIEYFDTRKDYNRVDDFMMAFKPIRR